LVVNGEPLTIVGVADPAYQQTDNQTVFYAPLTIASRIARQADLLVNSRSRWLNPVARLKPGLAIGRAQAEMDVLAAHALMQPEDRKRRGVLVSPQARDPELAANSLLFAAMVLAVSTILLIACFNLANLLLARAVVRRREIGVRLSLGATRARLIRQLLTESILLALASGALGILISFAVVQLAWQAGMPGLIGYSFHPWVLVYCLAISLAAGIAFGLAPALQASKVDLQRAMRPDAARGRTRPWSLRNLLVITPLAISLVLLSATGLSLRFMRSVSATGPTLDTPHLLSLSFRLYLEGYSESRTRTFQEDLLARLQSFPGVTSAALTMEMPFFEDMSGIPLATGAVERTAPIPYNIVSPQFFETAGVKVVRGRALNSSDTEGSPAVAVVSEGVAEQLWPGQNPLGQRVRASGSKAFFEVAGVVIDIRDQTDLRHRPRPTLYVAPRQAQLFLGTDTRWHDSDRPWYELRFLIHTRTDAAASKNTLRQLVRSADPSVYFDLATLAEQIEAQYPMHQTSAMLAVLGGLAMLMAAVGIYAILTYAVAQRTREIGIRMALGACHREVVALVMRNNLAVILCGLALGAAGALALSRVLSALFAGFGSLEPLTLLAAIALLGAVAALASYLPARKAVRVDPITALRCE
jgi:putative ABC transport system permease protein